MRKRTSDRWRGFGLAIFLLMASALALAACTPSARQRIGKDASMQEASVASPLSRADPGYLYWLERQSMLGTAPELLREVSATPLVWRFAPSPSRPEALLAGSGIWLTLSPQTFITAQGNNLLRELAAPASLALWRTLGLGGLLVEHGLESGRAWFPQRGAAVPDDDAVAYRLAADVGTEEEWAALMARGLEAGLQLGADLPGLATGLGPDFNLATAALRDWPGAYLMLAIPREQWSLLPETASGAVGSVLPAQTASTLAAAGLLPAFAGDANAHETSFWAATGEVRGHDGTLRRWVYRFDKDPRHPMLNWHDPSSAARRLLSAAIIQETGLRRTPLVRLHLEAVRDLALAGETLPALPEALTALAREVRRYGGWSLSTEPWPLPTPQNDGPDFVLDTLTFPALEWALLKGDARPLGKALRATVDQRRLWRPLSQERALDFRPFGGGVLYATLPGLAAMRLGLTTTDSDTARTLSPANAQRLYALHELALRVRGSLPGLLALNGADLTGLLVAEASDSATVAKNTFSAWGPGTGSASFRGVARGQMLYASPFAASHAASAGPLAQEADFSGAVRQMAALRAQYRLPEGVFLETLPVPHAGILAYLTKLPDGLLLTVANFSDTVQTTPLTLPRGYHGQGQDLLAPSTAPLPLDGRSLTLELPPFACRFVLFSTVSAP